ncbi:MAG TPA: hypothetical protein VFG42_10930 [Baekduia sp.]|uniref:hypothetical protein n=1 Tax=Baekduia sp. TaxID=2600305 RepID=UPI002D7A068A|nr:hypothetical protein [Baekduia sp.]HET6507293.1 hypothetical protein [Baekduia sp.]
MRRLVLLLCSALLLSGLLAGVADARQAIRGPGYRAYAPSGWTVKKTSSRGWRTVTIASPQRAPNRSPVALVAVATAPIKTIERRLKLGVSDKGVLAQKLISIPRDATLLQVAFGPSPTALAGARGAVFGVTYNLKGDGTQHSAAVVQHGRRIYMLQVVRDQSLSELGSTAADMVGSTWRWR